MDKRVYGGVGCKRVWGCWGEGGGGVLAVAPRLAALRVLVVKAQPQAAVVRDGAQIPLSLPPHPSGISVLAEL